MLTSTNLQVAGSILSPSDVRLKAAISGLDTRTQLQHLRGTNIVQFTYTQDYLATLTQEQRAALQTPKVSRNSRVLFKDSFIN